MEEYKATDYSYWSLIKDVYHSVRPYRRRFLAGSFFRCSADLMYLYSAYAITRIIGYFATFSPGRSLADFWPLLILWVGSYLYVNGFRQVGKYLCYTLAERSNLDLQLRAVQHLNRLDLDWQEKENTGNKLKRIQNGGEGLEKILRIWTDTLIKVIVNFSGMIIIVSLIDRMVAIIMVIFLITYFCLAIPLARRASQAAREVNQHEENFSGLMFEVLNNIRTVKAMGLFPELYSRLSRLANEIYLSVLKRVRRFRSKAVLQSYWALLFRVVAMIMIAFGLARGQYAVSFLILFNFYFTELRTSAEELSEASQDITISRYQLARLHTMLREVPTIDDETGKVDFPHNWQTISVRNLSFSYGNNIVLENISFTIRRGEKIGLVGISGAGKSTLFKLLLKEYENFTGEILFDDISIKRIKKSSYIQRVAVVMQETEVFNFSLHDNIILGAVDSSSSATALEAALEVSHVKDFLPKFPAGINTVVGEKGVKLSGGEKQRLGIARAICKQPDLLFLDEATSHLDLESEEKIKDSLHRFFEQVTAVVIAHRLTTIQEMDRILVIENGSLTEAGSFKELYEKRGRFFALWEKQRL